MTIQDFTQAHCSSCGTTDLEEVSNTYSGCCNKRVCHNLNPTSPVACCGAYTRAAEGTAPTVTVTWTTSTGPDDVAENAETVDPTTVEAVDLMATILEDDTMTPDAIEGTAAELALLDATLVRYHADNHLAAWRSLWREQAV